MKFLKIIAIVLTSAYLSATLCFAKDNNNLRTLFLNNQARIYEINIRNFNAQDVNGNEIIDRNEVSGNFINAIDRLDEIKELGINVLHVLPVTPVGRLKALGAAGSLYSMSDFIGINKQFADTSSNLSSEEQMKKFIEECHKRGIKVMIDLPSCGAYDMFLKHPELFIKDEKNCSIVPSDWTDVRLLNAGTNENLNKDVMTAHKKFIDFIIQIGADGLRADVATIKPYKFWEELIEYTREKDPEFMFLAEASDSWREPPSKYAEFTPYDELLKAGFDGYYGSFFNIKEWNAEQFYEHIKFNQKLLSSYPEKKSVIMSFTTHDEVSPIILHGENFSIMIAWLEATLPFNPYSIDGFPQGDDYLYPWANNKAEVTQTDDDFYFVHRGKLDIFNFSRKPIIKHPNVLENFKNAYNFRISNEDLVTNGKFIPINTNDNKIFAFIRSDKTSNILVIGSLDFNNDKDIVTIKIPKLKNRRGFDIIKGENIKFKKNRMTTDLKSGEIKVIRIN